MNPFPGFSRKPFQKRGTVASPCPAGPGHRKGRPGSGSGSGPGSGVGGRAPGSPGRTAFPTRDRGRGRSKPAARAGNAPGRSSGGGRLRWGEPGPSADRTRPGGVADGRRGSREPAGPPRLQTPLSWSRPLPRPHPLEARARLPQSPPLHSSPSRAPPPRSANARLRTCATRQPHSFVLRQRDVGPRSRARTSAWPRENTRGAGSRGR
jgi:hypothetical protein